MEASFCEVAVAKLIGLAKGVTLTDKEKAKLAKALDVLKEDDPLTEDTDG